MANLTLVVLAVAVLVASCSAEAPRFRKSKVLNKKFVLFQRQELPVEDATIPEVEEAAVAPYPPAGVTPETPFELPTETTVAPALSQEYGPPAQEYGPPAQEYGPPAQEYGPPAVEEVVAPVQEYGPPIIEDETHTVDDIIEDEILAGGNPQSERLVVYRIPKTRSIIRPSVRVLRLKH
ncbi:hypothetical protein ACFFRR_000401 [Megaselia abdita]